MNNFVSRVEVWDTLTVRVYIDGRLIEERPNPWGIVPYVIIPRREAKA